MKRSRVWFVGAVCATVALAAHAAGRPLAPGEMATRVSRGKPGQELTSPSNASPASVVGDFLRQGGSSDATVRSLNVTGQSRQARFGRVHLRMAQEVGGLEVSGSYVKATVDKEGRLLSLIESVVPVDSKGALKRAEVDEAQALRTALRVLELSDALPKITQRRGATTSYARGTLFYSDPTVTKVALATDDGSLVQGYRVEVWTLKDNELRHVLIGDTGQVVDVEVRTASDAYDVFLVDPITDGTQTTVPGQPNWLFPGTHRTIDIEGNNVHAYLDTENDSVPDDGGSDVNDGIFDAVFDDTIQPEVYPNPEVAVQNLFYLNNYLHDRLYDYGFDEAARNFQDDNFGNGGLGGDSVRAEAQDGGGTDNANFATPPDGWQPRMQMYLWNSVEPDHVVTVNSPGGIAGDYEARGAEFGPGLDATGVTGDVVVVDDGSGTVTDGCQALTNDVSGKIAFIDRGSCNFTVKVKNAQNGGAIGVIVALIDGSETFTMGGDDDTIIIPAVMINLADGNTIRTNLPVNATIKLLDPAPIKRDGDLDSDIVYHEYGHGLTWRMIGQMSGPMAGAIGEGSSDVLSILFNDDDVVGEYSTGLAGGIRSEPYSGYSRTYGDFTGQSVHFDGEIYAAAVWRTWELFQGAGAGVDELLGYVVDGMNYTRSHPTFEDMRDGILAAAAGSGRECLIWEAFAEFGIGVGAQGASGNGVRNTTSTPFPIPPFGVFQPPFIPIFESFATPGACD